MLLQSGQVLNKTLTAPPQWAHHYFSDQETQEQIGSFFQQQAGKATDAKESVTEEFAARACVALVQYIRVGGAVVVEV